ncbi:MAG: hypothetical protein LBH80_03140 [Prevotellaceae bacterium]|jgi:hypothetical protein|nr:hypothetical protein [Prevotellaceae bacterium]
MRKSETEELYVEKILEKIPPHIKPVSFLVENLEISKESAYRRLRGKIPFTFDEIIRLSNKLQFSLEEIVPTRNEGNIVFTLPEYPNLEYEDYLHAVLMNYQNQISEIIQAKENRVMLSMNHLWPIFIFGMEHFFKLFYYKWVRQKYSNSFHLSMRDLIVPEKIKELKKSISQATTLLQSVVIIADRDIYLNAAKELQYYYRRKLLTEEEFNLICDDLEGNINEIMQMVLEGRNKIGNVREMYISSLGIFSNNSYIEFDDKVTSFSYVYGIRSIKTTDPIACQSHKVSLECLKKNSVLISLSNEELQMDFFNKQKEYIKQLKNDEELIL